MVRGLSSGERAALVISECQRAMVDEEYRGSRDELARNVEARGTLEAIAELATTVRRTGNPVVHSWLAPHGDWRAFSINCALAAVLKRTGALRDGLPGVEPHPIVAPQEPDLVVRRRTGMTSFEGTDLDALLRAMRIDTVVLVGVSINVAVYGSMVEAVNRGYNVVVPRDCVAGVGRTAEMMLDDIYPLLATVTERGPVVEALEAR